MDKAGPAPGTTWGVEPALSRPWPSHSSNNCLSSLKGPNAPRQLPRPNLPAGLSKATLAATRPSQCFKPFRRPFQGNSRSYTSQPWACRLPQPYVFKGVEACRLLALKPFKPFKPSRRPSAGLSKATVAARRPSHLFFTALKVCLPVAKRFKPFLQTLQQAFPRQLSQLPANLSKATLAATRPANASNPSAGFPRQLSQLGRSSLPFACPQTLQTLQTLPQAFRRPFQSNCRSYTPQPSVFHSVEALFARRQTLQTLPSNPPASLSTAALAATRPSHLFLRAFKTAVCPPSKTSNPPAGLSKATFAASRRPFQATLAATHPSQCFKPFRRPFQSNCRSYTPQPSVFHGVEALFARRQTLQTLPSNPFAGLSTATLAATGPSHLFFRALKLCLPAVKHFKPFLQTLSQAFPRQLLQLHAPAICF